MHPYLKVTSDEINALIGLPYLQQVTYLLGIRPYMDKATALVGIKRGISYQSLAETLYVEPHQGIQSGSPSRQQLRRAIKALERAGLVYIQSDTLMTGLRESNVTQLKWSEIHLEKKHALIHADESKSKRPIPVPLSQQAIAILKDQIGKNPTYVFTYQGQPVTRCNNHAWRKALERAGISDFRWHDLRHTWASWHVQNGTPLHELQQLGGWSQLMKWCCAMHTFLVSI